MRLISIMAEFTEVRLYVDTKKYLNWNLLHGQDVISLPFSRVENLGGPTTVSLFLIPFYRSTTTSLVLFSAQGSSHTTHLIK